MRKTRLTDKGVADLKPRADRYANADPELRGHYVRVTPSGAKSYVAVTRNPNNGRQVWTTIGAADAMPIAEARDAARKILLRVRGGLPAVTPKGDTFGTVVDNWRKRHVEANGLISAPEINRLLDQHILPAWKDRPFTSIRRTDITGLLDKVEDGHGARAADYVLNVTRSIMFWQAARSDDYAPPIVRGMNRQKTATRTRVLDDGELRTIWLAAEDTGTFGAIIRMCLLTAQRSRKVGSMKWADLDLEAGVWMVPKAPREKDTGGALALPEMALAIIGSRPQLATNPHVFPGRGRSGPFRGFGSSKAALDAKLPDGMASWTVHDLRRTSRSLISRAGVRPDIAERVLGHAIRGVEGIYDRHHYVDEKRDALARLAALIDSIVHPRPAEIVQMTLRKRSRPLGGR
jgi:integrase